MPKTYPDLKLLDQMTSLAFTLHESVNLAEVHLSSAVNASDGAVSPFATAEELAEDIYNAARDMDHAYQQLRCFDKKLAKLLVLRGQLAEATGIPMFSHIGEDARYPDRESLDM